MKLNEDMDTPMGNFNLIKNVNIISQRQVMKLAKHALIVEITFDLLDTDYNPYSKEEQGEPTLDRTEVTFTSEWTIIGKKYKSSGDSFKDYMVKVMDIKTDGNVDKQLSNILKPHMELKELIHMIYSYAIFYYKIIKDEQMIDALKECQKEDYKKVHYLFQGFGYPNVGDKHPWTKEAPKDKSMWTSNNSWASE